MTSVHSCLARMLKTVSRVDFLRFQANVRVDGEPILLVPGFS
jgi:hypothetical protein